MCDSVFVCVSIVAANQMRRVVAAGIVTTTEAVATNLHHSRSETVVPRLSNESGVTCMYADDKLYSVNSDIIFCHLFYRKKLILPAVI